MKLDEQINADQLAVIALGGNLPGRYGSLEETLSAAVAALPGAGFQPLRRSRWWRSKAWPDPADPAYLNGVVLATTTLLPAAALQALHRLEDAFGRTRGARNGPRTLDLDLIALGRVVTEAEGLSLPHPRAAERFFVMGPLAEIAPGWRHPVLNATALALAQTAFIGRDAVPQ